MTERPTGPAQFPRPPYFVQMQPQRMSYPASVIVEGYPQMYPSTRPIQIMPQNGQIVNSMQTQQISATQPVLTQPVLQKREKKPLLIINPDTLKPADIVTTTIVKDSPSMGHINDNQSSIPSNNKPFQNSYSLNSINANQKPSSVQQTPISTSSTGTSTPPPAATSTSTTALAQTTTNQETKTKQSVQNDFAVNVLRRHTELEKQKSGSVATAQSEMKPESSNIVEPEKQDDMTFKSVLTNATDNSQIIVHRSAATEIPKSAVPIGPRHPSGTTPQQQASSPSSKNSVQKTPGESILNKFAPVQDESNSF
jgi:hypothetical protein